MSLRVTNIQRMCFDDGPGIRTTVFFKGCSLHCPWCANPENIATGKQAIANECYGTDYEIEDLLKLVLKDQKFWNPDGGITLSGGEALLQWRELRNLVTKLKEFKIHIAVETALFIPTEYVEEAAKLIDFFYVDVKILDANMCNDVLGGKIELFKKNVEKLISSGKELCFRIPCSKKYVLCKTNVKLIQDFVSKYSSVPIEIFSLHNLGEAKYKKLGLEPPMNDCVSRDELIEFQGSLYAAGAKKVTIIQL